MIAIVLSLFAAISPKIIFNISPHELLSPMEERADLSYIWWYSGFNTYGIAFFVGIIFGYLLDSNVKISQSKTVFFWIYAIAVCPLIYEIYNSFKTTEFFLYFWYTLGKLFFCTGIGWIFFACCTGRGGISLILEPFRSDVDIFLVVLRYHFFRIFQPNSMLEWFSTDSEIVHGHLLIAFFLYWAKKFQHSLCDYYNR